MLSISILLLVTLAGSLAFTSQRKAKDVAQATQEIKDAILQTQNLAYSPQDTNIQQYIFVAGLDDAHDIQRDNSITVHPYEYKILSLDRTGTNGHLAEISTKSFANNVKLTSQWPGANGAFYFEVDFRTRDGAPGFWGGKFYDSTDWSTVDFGTSEYADLKVTVNNKAQSVRVQKITGAVSTCTWNGATCSVVE